MAIKVRCPGCGKMYEVRDELAGKKGRCTDCGSIMPIPRPAAPEPTGIDAFDLDGLGELERAAPAVPPPMPARAVATAPAPAERRASRRANAGESEAAGPCVPVPGEEQIDRWVPLVLIILLAGYFVRIGWQTISQARATAQARGISAYDTGKAIGELTGNILKIAAIIPAILAPLCLLGLFIASRVLKNKLPSAAYRKSLAVMSLIIVLPFAYNGFDAGKPLWTVSWYVTVTAMVGVLWLLVRQRLVPFAVSLGCLAVTVGPPIYGVYWLIDPTLRTPKVELSVQTERNPSVRPRAGMPAPRVQNSSAARTPSRTAAEWTQAFEKLAAAVKGHQASHDGRLPAKVRELVDAGLLGKSDVSEDSGHSPIHYRNLSWASPPFPSALILADVVGGDHRFTILYADLRIETVDLSQHGDRMFASSDAEFELRRRQR